MGDVMIISGHQRVDVKRKFGPVTIMDATDRTAAMTQLKHKASLMGANAIMELRVCNTVADPHFGIHRLYLRGTAVRV